MFREGQSMGHSPEDQKRAWGEITGKNRADMGKQDDGMIDAEADKLDAARNRGKTTEIQ